MVGTAFGYSCFGSSIMVFRGGGLVGLLIARGFCHGEAASQRAEGSRVSSLLS